MTIWIFVRGDGDWSSDKLAGASEQALLHALPNTRMVDPRSTSSASVDKRGVRHDCEIEGGDCPEFGCVLDGAPVIVPVELQLETPNNKAMNAGSKWYGNFAFGLTVASLVARAEGRSGSQSTWGAKVLSRHRRASHTLSASGLVVPHIL